MSLCYGGHDGERALAAFVHGRILRLRLSFAKQLR